MYRYHGALAAVRSEMISPYHNFISYNYRNAEVEYVDGIVQYMRQQVKTVSVCIISLLKRQKKTIFGQCKIRFVNDVLIGRHGRFSSHCCGWTWIV